MMMTINFQFFINSSETLFMYANFLFFFFFFILDSFYIFQLISCLSQVSSNFCSASFWWVFNQFLICLLNIVSNCFFQSKNVWFAVRLKFMVEEFSQMTYLIMIVFVYIFHNNVYAILLDKLKFRFSVKGNLNLFN